MRDDMRMPFTKMQGLGNDFIVVRGDGLDEPAPATVRSLADRRTGIGFDQMLWLEAPRDSRAHVAYRIFNSDGSEAEQCGNGARCIARYLGDDHPQTLLLEHAGGLSEARIEKNGSVSVDMGAPRFDPSEVPFLTQEQSPPYSLDADGEEVIVRVVSMGNPHAVVEVEDVEEAPVGRLGPVLERHASFPNRANIGFMQVVTPDHVRLRVFERGVGETRACGTGRVRSGSGGPQLGPSG